MQHGGLTPPSPQTSLGELPGEVSRAGEISHAAQEDIPRRQPHQLKHLLKGWALPPYLAVVDPPGSISQASPPVSSRLLSS